MEGAMVSLQPQNFLDLMIEEAPTDTFICRLQRCRKTGNLAYAKCVNAGIYSHGLAAHGIVGNYVVPMFTECGSLSDSLQTFTRLVHRNVIAWTCLISDYSGNGKPCNTLNLYKKMLEDNVQPSSHTLVVLLKACSRLRDIETARLVHVEIIGKQFERDIFVGTALVDIYAKCGLLIEARQVFDSLPVRNVVSWTALISGYAEHGVGKEALKCFDRMQQEGLSPNALTYVCSFKACANIGAIDEGRRIHKKATEKGLDKHLFVGNSLIDMYRKCGSVEDAHKLFDKLPVRDVITWTVLIAGYFENGLAQKALTCFEQMQSEGISPNAITFVYVLKACGSIAAIYKIRQVHAKILKKRLENDVFVSSTLVDIYSKWGLVVEARKVFDKLLVRDVVSWTTAIAGYARHGHGQEALKCYEQMHLDGIPPNALTFVCALKACGSIEAINAGKRVHGEIAQYAFEADPAVSCSLVDMYAKCGLIAEARKVFDRLQSQDIASWNSLIAGYAEHGPYQEALNCLRQMQLEGICPDAVTFACTLKACGSIGLIKDGQEIHKEIVQMHLDKEHLVGSALIYMYAKCDSLIEARKVFDKLAVRDVVSWTTLIGGYAEHGHGHEALKIYEQMKAENVPPNAVTFACTLKACSSIGAIDKGQEIHMEITRHGLESDLFVSSILIDMYAKCGSLAKAQEVFDDLPVRDVVSWTALIAGYARKEASWQALKCFQQMQFEGVSPNSVTFICSLKACGDITAIGKGQEIHKQIVNHGLETGPFISSTLVDMYAKSGLLAEAQEIFYDLPMRDVVLWNTMIRGYGMNHENDLALRCFNEMQEQGVSPDSITFTCLLTSCSRANLVSEGLVLFNAMMEEYGILPTGDHYMCIVDLLARSGHLYEAEKLLWGLQPSSIETWIMLLSACKTYGEADVGLRCFQQLVKMNPENAASYVLMENIYGSAERWNNVNKIERLRRFMGAKKKPAKACIEVNKVVHEFVIGSTYQEEILKMLETLNSRLKKEGYVPNLELVLRPVSDVQKESLLCGHVERLAIAFGILHTSEGQRLHVSKNLRMCEDCHNTSKIISRIERREIIVKESNWIHYFKDGQCNCGDMW